MTAVWIALGAVGLSLMAVFISLNAAQTRKRKDARGDGASSHADTSGDANGSSDSADGGGD